MEKETKPSLSLDLIKTKTLTIFRETDAYGDEKGTHANTLSKSAHWAIKKLMKEYSLSATELYESVAADGFLPEISALRATHPTRTGMNRLIPKMLSDLTRRSLIDSNPELKSEEEYRIEIWGIIRLENDTESKTRGILEK